MMRKRSGKRKDNKYPILKDEGANVVVENKEKTELLVQTFVKVHRADNPSNEARSQMKWWRSSR